MRLRRAQILFTVLAIGCGSSHPVTAPHVDEPEPDAGEPAPTPTMAETPPEPPPPPSSTASYEDALSKPEALDAQDSRAHLTDQQLTSPMGGVMSKCGVPKKAKVVIRVAVQNGHAIGVTVTVTFEKPKKPKPPTNAAAKAEAKAKQKLATCVDQTVRGLSWPPSPRRDSFTTQF